MTNEYIHRIVDALTKYEISYVVTGGASEFIRNNKKITMDFDILVEKNAENYSRIDDFVKYFKHSGMASDSLKIGKIVRLNVFPFKIDILPRLDGLNTDTIIKEKALFDFQGKVIPLISERNLNANYQNFKRYE